MVTNEKDNWLQSEYTKTLLVIYIGYKQYRNFLQDTILVGSKMLNSNNQFKMYLWDL